MTEYSRALPRQAFGRDVRPATAVLTAWTGYIAILAIFGHSLLTPPWSNIVGIVGVATAGILTAGWWAQSVAAMSLGLLSAAWVWATFALTASQVAPWWGASAMGCWAWAGLAGGLWWRDHAQTGRRA